MTTNQPARPRSSQVVPKARDVPPKGGRPSSPSLQGTTTTGTSPDDHPHTTRSSTQNGTNRNQP